MATTHIRSRVEDGIGHITIDRAERFNSLDVHTAQDLRRAGLAMARDDQARVVVVWGVSGIFCSGADLKYIRAGGTVEDLGYLSPDARPTPEGAGERFKQILEYLHSTIAEIRRAPKPFVAAVDGVAAAGGFGLAMCCDLVYASERATFEWAYSKTGSDRRRKLHVHAAAAARLPSRDGARVAQSQARRPPRAWILAWSTTSFPTEAFSAGVMDIARRLAAGPPRAYGVAKGLIGQAAGMDRLDVHLDRELDHLSRIADGEEFAEGLDSFFEKRAARFGRG